MELPKHVLFVVIILREDWEIEWQYPNNESCAKYSKSISICYPFAVSNGVPFGSLSYLHFCLNGEDAKVQWRKMQSCEGKGAKKRWRKARDAKAKERYYYCSLAFALSPLHHCIFFFALFSLFRSITYKFMQVSFLPKLYAWSCLFLVPIHQTVWRPLC